LCIRLHASASAFSREYDLHALMFEHAPSVVAWVNEVRRGRFFWYLFQL
jgi:hypothetical protein